MPERRKTHSVYTDPNLQVPDPLILASDLDVFEMPDGLGFQIRGGATNILVRGLLADSALVWLLGQLKEATSLKDLLASKPDSIPQEDLDELFTLLLTRGLITSPPAVPEQEDRQDSRLTASGEILRRQSLYWGRKLGITRANKTAREVDQKLASAHIAIVGEGLLATTVFDVLDRSGLGNIYGLDCGDDGIFLELSDREHHSIEAIGRDSDALMAKLDGVLNKVDLLVTATKNASTQLFSRINQFCLSRECAWIRGNDADGEIEIGPYVSPFDSACYTCMLVRRRSVDDFPIEEALYQEHRAQLYHAGAREGATLPLSGHGLAFATTGGAMLAAEVIRIITAISAPTTECSVTTLSFDGVVDTTPIIRVPRCPDCFRGSTSVTTGKIAKEISVCSDS